MNKTTSSPVAELSPQVLAGRILVIRGQRVVLDSDLAQLYEVETKKFNQQIKRNPARFPSDFMFRLTDEEFESLRSQFSTSNMSGFSVLNPPQSPFFKVGGKTQTNLRILISQFVTSSWVFVALNAVQNYSDHVK